jgi:hypothetical protein
VTLWVTRREMIAQLITCNQVANLVLQVRGVSLKVFERRHGRYCRIPSPWHQTLELIDPIRRMGMYP